jgi:hypothetical protein
VDRFDLALRTSYAQAKELALAQLAVPLTTPGSFQFQTHRGTRFIYRYRYDIAGRRIGESLGPESSPETADKVRAAKAEIRDAETLAQASRTLRAVGFYAADNDALVTVTRLAAAGIFRGGCVLVGSHAFGAIMNDLGYRVPPLGTADVDVARARRIEVAALPEGGFLALLRETGLAFHEVPGLGRSAPATSFKVRGRALTVDLLVPAKGVPYRPVKVPELHAHATGLPFLDYLLEDPQRSVLLGRGRVVPVAVPHAGRFALHKLAVHSLRSPADDAKRAKDLAQATALFEALAEDADVLLDSAAEAMTKQLRTKARSGARRVLKALQGNTEAARVLEGIAA